jgi:hypothetical protein
MDGTIVATQRRKISPSVTMSDATTIKRACFYKNEIKGSNEKDSPTSLRSNSLFIPQEDHSDQRSLLQLRVRDEDIPSDDEDSENFESRDLDE